MKSNRIHSATLTIASLLAVSVVPPATAQQADAARTKVKIERPTPWSVSKLEAKPGTYRHGDVETKRKRSAPAIVSGLAMVGAGIAMMAASPDESPNQYLREGGTGGIACQANTFVNGSLTSSRSTTCSYKTVYEHTGVYRGGIALIGTGGLVTLFGMVKK